MNEREIKVFTPHLQNSGPMEMTEDLVAWAKSVNALLAEHSDLLAGQQRLIEALVQKLEELQLRS